MIALRRLVVLSLVLVSAASILSGCGTIPSASLETTAVATRETAVLSRDDTGATERFPLEPLDPARIDPAFMRQEVDYASEEAPGTIVVDPGAHYLYLIEAEGRALRYGVAVGKEGSTWSGVATIKSKQEWPDWYPTPEMLVKRPDIKDMLEPIRSGPGLPGGPNNPIGARGLYLWQGNKDTLYRIHGTTEPYSIGKSVSSGCIRMTNQDVIDLYGHVSVGAKVKVLPLDTASRRT